MLFGKLGKLGPIGNFAVRLMRARGFGLIISSCLLPLQPQVDGVATDPKYLCSFTLLHAVQLDGVDYLLAQVITVSFCH